MTTTPSGDTPAKDPADWTTGDEPATAPQLSYLQTLARESGVDLPADLTKAQASSLIDELQNKSPRVSDSASASTDGDSAATEGAG